MFVKSSRERLGRRQKQEGEGNKFESTGCMEINLDLAVGRGCAGKGDPRCILRPEEERLDLFPAGCCIEGPLLTPFLPWCCTSQTLLRVVCHSDWGSLGRKTAEHRRLFDVRQLQHRPCSHTPRVTRVSMVSQTQQVITPPAHG